MPASETIHSTIIYRHITYYVLHNPPSMINLSYSSLPASSLGDVVRRHKVADEVEDEHHLEGFIVTLIRGFRFIGFKASDI